MKKPLLFFAFSLILANVNAQTWNFSAGSGSSGVELAKAICSDAAGNIYVTGSFTNTVDFDFSGATANLTSNGAADIFIASYTSTGAYRWAVRAGGTANDNSQPSGGICTDGTSVYVTGNYNGASTAFGATNLTPNGGTGTDVYVAKLNATTGAWTWAMSMGGSGNVDHGVAMCLDPSGNPYLLGSFNSTMSGACNPTSAGGSDIFVSKLNPTSGACVWMSSGGSTGNDGAVGGGICYDPNTTQLVVASNFSTGTANFGGFTIPFVGLNDMCILELNSSTGTWLGAVGTGSSTSDDAIACAYDPSTGGVVVAGAFTGNMTLPGGIALTASSAGSQDAWFGRYSISTNGFIWAKSASGAGNDRANSIAVDGNGAVFITGQFVTSPTTFGALSLTNTNSSGFDDIFVAKYAAGAGIELWVTKNTNTGVQPSANNGRAITYAGSNNVWIAGQFAQGATFGALTPLNSAGFNDFYVAKLGVPAALPVELSSFISTCENESEQINWTSESENRFDYYEIEKSYDLEEFISLGTVDAVGESTTTQQYSFELPLVVENTQVYYRLRMVNQDGSSEFSDIISGTFCDGVNTLLKNYFFSDGVLTLELNEANANVELFSITGQRIAPVSEVDNGNVRKFRFATSGLQVYILRITSADGSKTSLERICF